MEPECGRQQCLWVMADLDQLGQIAGPLFSAAWAPEMQAAAEVGAADDGDLDGHTCRSRVMRSEGQLEGEVGAGHSVLDCPGALIVVVEGRLQTDSSRSLRTAL